ncbi:macro domain-containing protein [Sphingomonas rosea]|uniref:macro domain-containing protein n=1 Tax=Sphingomonas rosea TaxID=335605 RepID=UPI0031DA384D
MLGAIWLLTEVGTRSSAGLDHWLDEHGTPYLGFAIFCALVGFLWAIYEPRKVAFDIPLTSTRLTLKYGNLFKEDADWLIGVNEFFDSRIGDVVAKGSIHGQVICDYFGGDEAKFRTQVTPALQPFTGTTIPRTVGETTRYEIGTTAVLDRGDKHIYLVALSRTDVSTNKAQSSIPELWTALSAALCKVHERGNGQPLALPLLGNGRASINLPPQHLLRLVVLAIVDYAKTAQLPNSVSILLHEDCFSVLDLTEIRRDWSTK